jgi:hypothetical protein
LTLFLIAWWWYPWLFITVSVEDVSFAWINSWVRKTLPLQILRSLLAQVFLKDNDVPRVAFVNRIRQVPQERNQSDQEVQDDIEAHLGPDFIRQAPLN